MAMIIAALGSGLVFGLGLVISGMTQPSKVLGFFDVFGHWDPTLAIVMAGALVVVAPGFALLRGRDTSILGVTLDWPSRRTIDRSLIGGAVLFGIGWGLVGLCPGPALANLAGLSPKVFGFVVAMAIGARAQDALRRIRGSQPQSA
ncbi:DUF6691 family protein [Bradyrhizobium sp.]|uniref:DUF6691 family protein n=1 Tax=Bradyrhizobium sp. TaxID=376 RepID=UPI003D0F3E9A